MRCLVGVDDTDSSRGYCTTYLTYRIAVDLFPLVDVLPYPRLVRLNPNIPFKTRGNAAVCLLIETDDPDEAFARVCEHVRRFSDLDGGANSGVVMLESSEPPYALTALYRQALSGVVNPARARRIVRDLGAKSMELGNGMGVVGASSALGFDERMDHTFELISYREEANWGTKRLVDPSSVRAMDSDTFPRTYNNYDYQKKKVLVSPHGPDPVLAGVRGESPEAVLSAYRLLNFGESPAGHILYVTNQHTDAHLQGPVEWKAFSSGWMDCVVDEVSVGQGGHVYVEVLAGKTRRRLAAYEPTGDLRRVVRLLQQGDRIRAFGGVRKPSSLHPDVMNLEKLEVVSLGSPRPELMKGVYVSSPRANRHLTKPLVRYGAHPQRAAPIEGWLSPSPRQRKVLVRSR